MATLVKDLHPGFRFQGQYTESDLDALAQFTVSQLLDQRIGRATMSATLLLAIGALLFRSWAVALLGFLVILVISALMRYVFLPRRLMRHARALPGLTGNRAISLDERTIQHQTEGRDQLFPKEAIQRLVLHKSHLFILFKPRGCLMVPLAWIQAPATIDRVVEFLVRRNDD